MSNTQTQDWQLMPIPTSNTFNQHFIGIQYCVNSKGHVDVKFAIDESCSNEHGFMHGAYLAAAAEMVLSLPLWLKGSVEYGRMVTVDFDLKYVANGKTADGLQAEVEMIHETGRLGFVRGLLKQNERVLLSFQATMRKLPPL